MCTSPSLCAKILEARFSQLDAVREVFDSYLCELPCRKISTCIWPTTQSTKAAKTLSGMTMKEAANGQFCWFLPLSFKSLALVLVELWFYPRRRTVKYSRPHGTERISDARATCEFLQMGCVWFFFQENYDRQQVLGGPGTWHRKSMEGHRWRDHKDDHFCDAHFASQLPNVLPKSRTRQCMLRDLWLWHHPGQEVETVRPWGETRKDKCAAFGCLFWWTSERIIRWSNSWLCCFHAGRWTILPVFTPMQSWTKKSKRLFCSTRWLCSTSVPSTRRKLLMKRGERSRIGWCTGSREKSQSL